MGMFNDYLLTVNAIACAVIAVRLTLYQRSGATHRPIAAWFAYVLIVACGSITIRVLAGTYTHGNWSETLINLALCVAIIRAHGNVMRLANPGVHKHEH